MKNLLLLLAVNLLFLNQAWSQKVPIKWGKLTKEEIDLKTCELDTSANAVILCDYGEIWFIPGQPIEVKRIKRIKILKKQGVLEQADISIPYYSSEGMENVMNVNAQTINVLPDGKLNFVKVEKNKIYDIDESKKWKEIRFSFPTVEVGSILEYSYSLLSKYYMSPKDWYFQSDIPTLHSEYRAKIEEGLDVRYFLVGTQLQHVYGGKSSNVFALGYLNAIKDEPYCPNPHDFVEKVFFQLAGYDSYKEGHIERIITMTTWEKLAIELLDDENFSSYLKKKQLARDFLEKNITGLANMNKREQVIAIYNLVAKSIKWDGKYTLNIEKSMKELLESKIGSGIEINMLLTSLLQSADIETSPALLSTKSNGVVTKDYPVINDFNHVICNVRLFETDMLLDATDPFRPYDLLAPEHLNPSIFVVDIKNPRLINPQQTAVSKSQITIYVDTITESQIKFKSKLTFNNYSAIQIRKKIQKADKPSLVAEEILFPENSGVKSDSCIIENQNDITKILNINYYYQLEKDNGGTEGYLYIKPFAGIQIPKFTADQRILPIDFTYKKEINHSFIFRLPTNYELLDIPVQQEFNLLKDAAFFRLLVKKENNILTVRLIYKLDRTLYSPSEYQYVKDFYQAINKALETTIVLKEK